MAVADSYSIYKQQPTPDTLNLVVNDLRPAVAYSLSSLNAGDDPIIQSKAKMIVAGAVKSYSPDFGATLETHVANQLQQLNREVRKYRSPLQLSERHQLDAYAINKAEAELQDKHGREPNVNEVADHIGLSVARIEKIKKNSFSAGTEMFTPEGEDVLAGAELPSYEEEAIRYVYDDADYKDQKIIEHKMGYGGAKELSNEEIASKLRIHPAQISRRSAKLLLKVNEYLEALEGNNT